MWNSSSPTHFHITIVFAQAIWERNKFLQFYIKIINILALSQEADQEHFKKDFLLEKHTFIRIDLESQFCYVLTGKHASDYSKGKNHQEFPNTLSCWFQCASLASFSIPASSKVSEQC